MPENYIGVEDPIRYDGIAFYQDSEWNRYSRNLHPIEKDEMCKYWKVYKVEETVDWDWPFDCHYKIIAERLDEPIT